MFRHLPPPSWYPTSHSPTQSKEPCGRWTSSSPTRKGRRRAKGLQELRPFTRSRGEQAKSRPACAATHAPQPPPHRRRAFGRLGPGAQSFIKTLLRLRSARLSHIDSDDYDAARVGHYYTQRLVVSSLRAQATSLRRKAVWEVASP